MQEYGQRRYANWIGLFLLACSAVATSGCASMYHLAHYNWLATFEQSVVDHHRPYFHSGRTGRIIAKTHRHSIPVEPDCFGYEPTCWYNWPSHYASCPPPDQIVEEEVVEPQRMQDQGPEEAPAPPSRSEGLNGILDLDDPKPGESPILPNRGTSVAPPAQMRQAPPEPGLSITKQESGDALMHDEAESPNVIAWESAIARRSINQRTVIVDEAVRPVRVNRNDRPLAFVDSGAEVDDITPDADVLLRTDNRPAPPAIAPSVVQSAPQATAPSLVQAASIPTRHGAPSRRTIRFAPAIAKDQLTADTTGEVEPPSRDAISKTQVEQKAEPISEEPAVQAVQTDLPATREQQPVKFARKELPESLAEQAVQTAENQLPETLNAPLVQDVQEDVVSLPSFKIIAVGPDAPEKRQPIREATKPATTIRFAPGKQPKAVRVSAREGSRGEASSDLKFR